MVEFLQGGKSTGSHAPTYHKRILASHWGWEFLFLGKTIKWNILKIVRKLADPS